MQLGVTNSKQKPIKFYCDHNLGHKVSQKSNKQNTWTTKAICIIMLFEFLQQPKYFKLIRSYKLSDNLCSITERIRHIEHLKCIQKNFSKNRYPFKGKALILFGRPYLIYSYCYAY